MHRVKKLFFVPVGLPGMGKSTLAKNIRLTVEKNLQKTNFNFETVKTNQAVIPKEEVNKIASRLRDDQLDNINNLVVD